MRLPRSSPLGSAVVLALTTAAFATAPLSAQAVRTGAVAERYATLCAACHGKNLEGAQAPSMLDDVWAHGSDDESLAKSIRNGFPEKGMPAWGAAIPDKEIRAMVIYIREQRAKFARENTVFTKPADSITSESQLHPFRIDTWVSNLKEPWSLAFLPNGIALATEKRGTLRLIENGQLAGNPITGMPAVDDGGQAGLFDVVPHPDYAKNGWLYLAYSDPQKNAEGKAVSLTRIIRAKLKDGALAEQQTIFQGPLEYYRPAGGVHFGGRIAFDRAGFLFFTIGERGDGKNAQDLARPTGKIHRIYDDGRIPADNPFANDPKADRTIWSYGHRNPQGLAFHPVTGELYDAEHGPRGGDELNLVRKGLNYGWPIITYGMNYDGTAMVDITAKEGMEQPITYWVPSIAPCGANFYTGDLFPKWKNHLFVASLAAEELRRLELMDGKVVAQEIIFKNLGRIRHVITGPDGALYVLLPSRIARITPAK
ncbi:MAG: PQQ-dependent sugar dehydrogenase [Undibacterium sp.]|nr:PQQ-dependent sugar dehydrogenase [Opitutaceae bacterium]